MSSSLFTRRGMLLGTGASLVGAALRLDAQKAAEKDAPKPAPCAPRSDDSYPPTPDQLRRLKWWKEARYGLFIHYGLYSLYGRQEWAVEKEAIPWPEYEQLAHRFSPRPDCAKEWARIAKAGGMRYMVFTAKHHEGFCNWDTKLTDFNSVKQGPKRDLVREYVEAAREAGIRVGIYFSLMDWHHPDGERCSVDEAARRRFVDYTHGLLRELLTNYGKIDILWYDAAMPMDAKGWESERMDRMVFELQPDIVVNGRNDSIGDFSTPEQHLSASAHGRAWESCMTLNESWGYCAADHEWKSPRTLLANLITCARDQGNYLINVGPMGDGTFPEESVRILTEVGTWIEGNAESIFNTDLAQPWRPNYALYTRRGNTLYMHVHMWPGSDVSLSGLQTKVLSVRMLRGGAPLKFTQDAWRVHIAGLPEEAPDRPATTLVLECESEPRMNSDHELRLAKPRGGVNIG
ncbi:alpha-L-fucosidase [Silvibacterium sp.]|uniref:alpha-L-fucosidase n=1 Tax=Silvibacterium sp. TaxID=1964179 RepID=UPI0039E65F4C